VSNFCNNIRLLGLNNGKTHEIPRTRHTVLISVLCVDVLYRYFNCLCRGSTACHWNCGVIWGVSVPPGMSYEWIWNDFGTVIGEGKQKYLENNWTYYHIVLPISHTDPVVRGEKPTANCLSYCTAYTVL
jgi:hypothetical protein